VSEGTVTYRGWAGGFGNLVKVRHANGFVSYYAHLSGFHKDVRVGANVEQKQTIGYVGQTGLATGPHVCFRVAKDGHYVNPLRLKSPAGEPVDDEHWVDFQTVRDTLFADLDATTLVATDEAL
jgi:murein DD-endopeptidase MepM/ murein hydrolase activator NlpD